MSVRRTPPAPVVVGAAIAAASAMGWVLLVVVGRAMSPGEFGTFVAFWGVTFGLASSLSNVEQETARRAATQDLTTPPSAGAVLRGGAVIATLVGALTLVPAVGMRVFGSPEALLGAVVLVSGAGFAVQFATRGALIGSGRTMRYGVVVVVEAALRLVGVGAVVLAARAMSPGTAAVCVGLGSFAWLAAPGTVRRLVATRGRHQFSLGLRRAGSLMVAAAFTAVLITGFPTLVTAVTGEKPGAAGGSLFAALTISRVPLLLVSPIQALTVPAVVQWRTETPDRGGARLRTILVRGGAALAALALLGAVAGWLAGPWAVRIVYGDAYQVPAGAVALLVASAVLLAGALLVSAALIAVSKHRRMTVMWLVALVATVAWLLVSRRDLVTATAWAALVGPVCALTVGATGLWRAVAARPTDSATSGWTDR